MSLTYDLNVDVKIPDFIKEKFSEPAGKEIPKKKKYKKGERNQILIF